jgi:hypothetical protein
MDGAIFLVTANLVTDVTVEVEALEKVGIAEAIQVGGIVGDRCRMRNTVELSYEDDGAATCAARDTVEIED